MFEEQYRSHYQNCLPSDALNEETLALMREALDHGATDLKKARRRRPVLICAIIGVMVAVAAALVILGFRLARSTEYEDVMGDIDQAFSQGAQEESDLTEDSPQNPEENETAPPADSEAEDTPEEDGGEEKPGGESEGDHTDEPSDLPQEDEPIEDSSSGGTTASPGDPYGPEISEDKNTETYLSIRAFLDALAKKEAGGYGKNYYNVKDLIIVPKKLPEGARFRHLYLNTKNGKYFYSYLFSKDGRDYLLDVEVNAKTPKTLPELTLQKNALAKEEILTGKKEDQLYFLFGERDEVTVTLTDTTATVLLTEEETAALLAQFALERCSLVNSIVDMKY